MLDISAMQVGAKGGTQIASNAQADRLLSQARSSEIGANGSSKQDEKIAKAGKDFESILLGTWLQEAEQTFAKVPGGDGQDEDSSSNQFQGIAMQALAGSLTSSGGIGIARMITRSLHRAGHAEAEAKEEPANAGLHTSNPASLTDATATGH